jgi:hypothetical protein
MRTTTKGTLRQAARRQSDHLADGVGGTITGGPMPKLNLIELLNRGGPASRGGAVSGAAQVVDSRTWSGSGVEKGIALSDGSRISFASIEDRGIIKDDFVRGHAIA